MTEPLFEHDRLAGDQNQPIQSDEELKRALTSAGNPLALLEMAHDAIIVRDMDDVVQFWNRGAVDMYGWTAKEATRQPSRALLHTKFIHSRQDIDWALMNVGHWEGELDHRRKDGSRIQVSSRQALRRNEDGEPVFVLEINQDITHRAYLALLQEVGVAASESQTIPEAVNRCLTLLCRHTGWCLGRACLLVTDKNNQVGCEGVWYVSEEKRFDSFRDFSENNPLALVEGLAGRVLQSREPVWIRDIEADRYFSVGSAVRDARIKSAFGFPVLAGAEVVAVLELFSETPMYMNDGSVAVLANVGRQLGRVFERVSADESQRRLSVSLLRSQDDERRRIARELHDSAGQYLAGVRMCLDGARREADKLPVKAAEKLQEAADMAKKCETEVRTLSYLLHPPLLEELGLSAAANWFAEGFSSRSGVRVKIDVSPNMPRLEKAIELTLFRILQECLTNIHRHSGSKSATVKITADAKQVSMEVRDQGSGIPKGALERWSPAGPQTGVGISGMRERVKDLGGTLEIATTAKGATVKATVPISAAGAVQSPPAPPDSE